MGDLSLSNICIPTPEADVAIGSNANNEGLFLSEIPLN